MDRMQGKKRTGCSVAVVTMGIGILGIVIGGLSLWQAMDSKLLREPQPTSAIPRPAPSPRWERARQEIEDSLAKGQYTFKADPEIRQGKTGHAAVTVQLGEHKPTPTGKDPTVEGRVSPVMEAELRVFEEGLEIEQVGKARQPVQETVPTEWSWKITPVASGDYTLKVAVYAKVKIDGKEESLLVFSENSTLEARRSVLYTVKQFVATNWEILMGSPVVLGALAWAWSRLGRKKEPRPAGFGS